MAAERPISPIDSPHAGEIAPCIDDDPATHFLQGGGEMGARMRRHDWTRTPLGALSSWPQSLKTIVRVMLDSRYAMWMGRGDVSARPAFLRLAAVMLVVVLPLIPIQAFFAVAGSALSVIALLVVGLGGRGWIASRG